MVYALCSHSHDTFPHSFLCSKSKKKKKKKRNINNDLAVLPSHDISWAWGKQKVLLVQVPDAISNLSFFSCSQVYPLDLLSQMVTYLVCDG